jgi:hypothetical protein
MESVERSGSGDRNVWRVKLATGVRTVAGASVGLVLRRDLGSFWLGRLAFGVVTATGGVPGRLADGLLFRPTAGGEHDPSRHA